MRMSVGRLRYALHRPVTWEKFWCRLRNHPAGFVWLNASGYEPNMHCRNCDDNLG